MRAPAGAPLVALFASSLLAGGAACGGQTGDPAEPSALELSSLDATVADVEASAPSAPIVRVTGHLAAAGSDASVSKVVSAFVVAEVGGLRQPNPAAVEADGSFLPTTDIDLAVRYGQRVDSAGGFSFALPAGTVGLYAFALPFVEAAVTATTATSPDAPASPLSVPLTPLASAEGGIIVRPTAQGLAATPPIAAPYDSVTITANLAAASSGDPLSGDVFLIESSIGWAGALVPPLPAVPGGPHPDGEYNRLITAPATPGVYTYTLVLASMAGVPAKPLTVTLTVTPTGAPPFPEAGADGSFFVDGGGDADDP